MQENDLFGTRIAPILPPVVMGFHAHVWNRANWRPVPWEERAPAGVYMVTETEHPVDSLLSDGRPSFPDREFRAVCFGHPGPMADDARDTAFVAAAGRRRGMVPWMVVGSELSVPPSELRRRMEEGNFLGYMVFLNWLGDDYGDKKVEDRIGPAGMGLAEGWPRARIVLAHCGRCCLPEEMEQAAPLLGGLPNVSLGTAMVMDETTLQIAFQAVVLRRVLFATDLPVAALKGCRKRVAGHWVDVVQGDYPPSAYRVQAEGIHAVAMAPGIAMPRRPAGMVRRIGEARGAG